MIALPLSACSASALHPLPAMLQGATGSMVGTLDFRNVSSRRCTLGARPRAAIVLGGRVLATKPARFPSPLGGRVARTVRAGRHAGVYLQWSNWCGAWPAGLLHTVRVRLVLTTGVRLTARVRTGRPRCDMRSQPAQLRVSAFTITR